MCQGCSVPTAGVINCATPYKVASCASLLGKPMTENCFPAASAARRQASKTAKADESNSTNCCAPTTTASGCANTWLVKFRARAPASLWVILAGRFNVSLISSLIHPSYGFLAALLLLRSAKAAIRPSIPLALISCANCVR